MSAEATNPRRSRPVRPQARPAPAGGPPRIDLRRLGRAALLGPATRDRLPDAIGHVAEAHRAHHPDADLDPLRRAYVLAESSHRGQMRKSGEPYITHPLAVTLILAELGAETTTLTASLLHDTVEDTEVTLDQVRRGVRRRGLLSRRRRHQAGEGRLRRRRRARDLPQDARRHRQRRPRDVDQTRRPAAQHAHPRRDAPRETGPHRQGHPGRADPARRTARRPGAQDRAGRPGLRDPPPRGVRAHPGADRRQRGPRRRPARRDRRRGARGAARRRHPGRSPHPATALRLRAPGRRASAAELRGSDFGRLLVLVDEDADCYARPRRAAHLFHPGGLGVQGLHRRPQVQPVPVAAHRRRPRGRPGRRSPHPHPPDAQGRRGRRHRARQSLRSAVGGSRRRRDAPDDGERVDPTRPGWLSRLLDWQQAAPDPDTFWSDAARRPRPGP